MYYQLLRSYSKVCSGMLDFLNETTWRDLFLVGEWLASALMLFSVMGIVLAFFLFVLSGGSEGRIRRAKRTLFISCMWFVFAVIAFWLLSMFEISI